MDRHLNINSNSSSSLQNSQHNIMLSPSHRHRSMAPPMSAGATGLSTDSTQTLNNMMNRLSFSAGGLGSNSFTGSPSVSSVGITSNQSLGLHEPLSVNAHSSSHYIIKIKNIPNDISLREAHVMFSLCPSGIVDIDVTQENNSGEKAIKVLLTSLQVATNTATVLDSKVSLFGPGFPFKSYIQLFDVQSQQTIPFQNLSMSASVANPQLRTESYSNQSALDQQQGLFGFVDPFSARSSLSVSSVSNTMGNTPVSRGAQTSQRPNNAQNTASLHLTQDLMMPSSPFEDRPYTYDDLPTTSTTTNSSSNIWNSNSTESQGSIFLASTGGDDGNLSSNQTLAISAQPELLPSSSSSSISTVVARAPEWGNRSPSTLSNSQGNNMSNSPSNAYKTNNFSNNAPRYALETNFLSSPLSNKMRDHTPQTGFPPFGGNNSSTKSGNIKQSISPTNKSISMGNVRTSGFNENSNNLLTSPNGMQNSSSNGKKTAVKPFATIDGMTEDDLNLLARVPPPANPADQNPPCNTLYVGNLPPDASEQELRQLFSLQNGFRRLSFRNKNNGNNHGPMCFVEFEDVIHATRALAALYGSQLPRLNGSSHHGNKGGIRLSFSKNPLGVRSSLSSGSGSPVNGNTRRSIAISASGAPTQSVLSTLPTSSNSALPNNKVMSAQEEMVSATYVESNEPYPLS